MTRFRQVGWVVRWLSGPLIVAAFAIPVAAAPTYSDVGTLSALARVSISAVTQVDLMGPASPGVFSPLATVSRSDAVAAVAQVLALPSATSPTPSYTDVAASAPAFGAIEAALAAGLMAGWAPASGAFEPSAPITRAQFAVLATNAMALQAEAQSLDADMSTFGYLRDLTLAGYDLGDVNAMLEQGIVPPVGPHRFAPTADLTREALAIGLYRMFLALDVPRVLALTPAAVRVEANAGDNLALGAFDRLGRPVPEAFLSLYPDAYSATPGGSASVSSVGVFTASSPGMYTVDVSVSGPFLPAPVTASATVEVTSPPAFTVSAVEVAGGIRVSWTGTAGQGAFTVGEAANGSSTYTAVASGTSATAATVTGLAPGDSYTFKVHATRAAGAVVSPPTPAVLYGASGTGYLQVGACTNSTLTLVFNNSIDPATLSTSNLNSALTVSGGESLGSATASWNVNGTELTIAMTGASVTPGASITTSGVTDMAGNPVASPLPILSGAPQALPLLYIQTPRGSQTGITPFC